MSHFKPLQLAISFFAILFTAASTVAQPSPDELIAQAQKRAAKIAEYREVLNNPDQNVRLAALDIMLKFDDPVMREVAYNQAFMSADETMRAVALRNRLKDLSQFTFQLSLTDKPTELERKGITDKFQGIFGISIETYDVENGIISRFNGNNRNTGQVSGTSLVLSSFSSACRGNFTLGDGPILEGEFTCSHNHYKGIYKASVKLI